jgi:hypothetical protein
MPYYDNPAGRLHDLLVRLADQPRNGSLQAAWAAVLGVDVEDIAVYLGRIADLVRETQEAVDNAGEDALLPMVSRFRDSWAQPIFPRTHAFSDRLDKVLPDQNSLDTLGIVSAHLHAIAPEAVVPDESELERRKEELRRLIDEVGAAKDIPDEVKHLLIVRLRGVEEAIEHLNVGGPGAIQRAMEAAIGSLLTTPEAGRAAAESPTIKKVVTTLWVIWAVFSAGQPVHDSIEGWGDTVQMLSSGPEEPSQENQESGPSASANSDDRHEDPVRSR